MYTVANFSQNTTTVLSYVFASTFVLPPSWHALYTYIKERMPDKGYLKRVVGEVPNSKTVCNTDLEVLEGLNFQEATKLEEELKEEGKKLQQDWKGGKEKESKTLKETKT